MSVVISETVQKQYFYPQLGVYMPGVSEKIDVTYTAITVGIDGEEVTAQFSVSIAGCLMKGHRELSFTPESMSGDLLVISEAALKNAIENPVNEADDEPEYVYADTNASNPLS
ncbi:TPA: hypothetical protein MFY04_06765 [Klebsiella pneumoniae]|uniref:hypothetical protein n=1 Tax=Klebsiella pneumoniae TaxID=573 RepID=UPI000B9668EF|nr:hypothetical protein [Klebsiella pneumoniae]OYQ26845.1 hypothetical protein B7475_10845 [Klebsiella pneumoniae]ROU10435.1 hypothetical protein EB838_26800 [Klebsiella pneumoniae]HBX0084781.1 hypothetical protein [Klebsiella pneumoniae]HBX0112125.1 hypothetical protein [Klebsiella pneumoniae]HBX0118482.1 hypothetical protein [Klebsiella pneumoniae]